ncbi:MAG: 3-isopropylmalate dehydratase [Armatimonadota bacterium]|nr:3-isopropylmalate dehydratase [Armatimonadota bacterium]MDR7402030.1 3-isopropylmalate dehydratase [Armatimonadota bacterium]MDR7437993.1 3-isopropylmalate dehydratase [Armatimonadota bacterium]MDR7473075.1 3-isopropylmalate dehydratase [Armatimonadota bacterium]MDR7507403.1 3-isopropylmalate dehydratase [Armatimonadota bacterium]
MILRGRVHRLGDDINTDYIIPARYKSRTEDIASLVPVLFEDLDPTLTGRIRPGDIIAAGENFGMGSSRETAPRLLRAAGIGAVLARSFARIFFRNAVNVGLPVIECDTGPLADGDQVEVDLGCGEIRVPARGVAIRAAPLPPLMAAILEAGGIRDYLRRQAAGEGGVP